MNRPVVRVRGQKGLLLVFTVGRSGDHMKLSVFDREDESGAFACADVQGDAVSVVITEDVTFEIEDRTNKKEQTETKE